jgi:hypothetical protein
VIRKPALALVLLVAAPSLALAGDPPSPLSDTDVLGAPDTRLRVESVMTRVTAYDQHGQGYQSKAGPLSGPGSERLTVFEPQVEIVATQGDRLTHRIWIPLDVISAASPHALQSTPDVVSGASRHTESGTLEWTTDYKASRDVHWDVTNGLHLENPFRSWNTGVSVSQALADQNTVVSAGVIAIFDWFDRFFIDGLRNGRAERSSTLLSAGLSQVLSPTTVANVNYGLTVQVGELGNTWNVVPLTTGDRGGELLPDERWRHAVVGRLSQFLPWNGALRLYYRFYADDWGIVAHSMQGQLLQRLTPTIYVAALYRFHAQSGPRFFTTLAAPDAPLRVADSDLAPLDSHTIGAKLVGDAAAPTFGRLLHYEVGYDRYWRTNDLTMDIVTCSLGFRF